MSSGLATTPHSDGFRMPGEFEPHTGCWMAWPERADNWRQQAAPAQDAFVAVAEAIHQSDPVTITVSPEQFATARNRLSAGIRVREAASDDAWMRDIGPTFVTNALGERRAVDWRFNAWGGHYDGLYDDWQRDDAMAAFVARTENATCYRAPIVLEGGAVHVDGEGTAVVTAECLLSPGRNPDLSQAQIETHLRTYLGVETVLWVPHGLFNDETTGHVDNILHVPAPGVIALSWTDDGSDPQYARSLDALRYLDQSRDARGRGLKVVKLPLPGPLHMSETEASEIAPAATGMTRVAGERLAASYANFYIANTRVIFPLLDERHDAEAKDVLQGLFPSREIIGIPAREILLGGGNIHCITQQVPA